MPPTLKWVIVVVGVVSGVVLLVVDVFTSSSEGRGKFRLRDLFTKNGNDNDTSTGQHALEALLCIGLSILFAWYF